MYMYIAGTFKIGAVVTGTCITVVLDNSQILLGLMDSPLKFTY